MTEAQGGGAHRPGGRLRVLLVDDGADLRLLLRSWFSAYPDIDVVGEAADGRQAIEVAAQTQPDLIVLDLTMPVLDGLEALPELTRVAPAARVVVLSAIPRSVDPGAMAAGAVAYVEKSVLGARELVPELLAGAGLLDAALSRLDVERDSRAEFDPVPTSPRDARRFARDLLSDQMEELLETVDLLLTEMVTNAIVHAGSATTVSIQLLKDRVHVEVLDQSRHTAVPRQSDEDAETGRGLFLVEALAEAWGTTWVADGKIVWFDVERPMVVEPRPA
jgi:DNA-binding NarL/FixJ family response regulator